MCLTNDHQIFFRKYVCVAKKKHILCTLTHFTQSNHKKGSSPFKKLPFFIFFTTTAVLFNTSLNIFAYHVFYLSILLNTFFFCTNTHTLSFKRTTLQNYSFCRLLDCILVKICFFSMCKIYKKCLYPRIFFLSIVCNCVFFQNNTVWAKKKIVSLSFYAGFGFGCIEENERVRGLLDTYINKKKNVLMLLDLIFRFYRGDIRGYTVIGF